jgi:hypothetical protein
VTDHGLLLAYLSELGSGSWTKFRAALDTAAGEEGERMPSVRARALADLGHAEFAFYGDLRWAVCPSALAWLPRREEPTAVLCGARTERLVDRLRERAAEATLKLEERDQPGGEGPVSLFFKTADREALEELARLDGLDVQYNAAGLLAGCLPSLDGYARLHREVPGPSGYEIEAFDPARLCWSEVPEATGDGLYRYKYYRPEYRLRTGGRDLKVSRETGIYLLLSQERRRVLHYDPARRELVVPAAAPLPDLHARAATLCSGLLPAFERRDGLPCRLYGEVPAGIALAIIEKLDQDSEDRS